MPPFDINYEDGIELLDQAIRDAEDDVIRSGLSPAKRPQLNGEFYDMPTMPSDLSSVGARDLRRLLGEFTRWFDYASGQLGLARSRVSACTEKKLFARGKVRASKEGTVADKDDATSVDSRYINVVAEYEHQSAKHDLIKQIADGLKRNIETLSRAIHSDESVRDAEGFDAAAQARVRAPVPPLARFRGRRRP